LARRGVARYHVGASSSGSIRPKSYFPLAAPSSKLDERLSSTPGGREEP
jgi:hypothetical protein